ncbi:Gfo/Idh/MocA family protein [Cohnella sp. REN36]|uniref:Gfo/Idh/MocA family protein n=1 Tax=Cohnella sp. REN36 TaxID=2887347 RepID=UPI001D140F2F|nr:Gfo/Idh/MocA family oxidoreductase [Cohnella sp. REN36]MCC3374195.1 Gfo/Idh/MocA family oxidoreductase [Cohnella sp. REN36]
MSKVRVAVAGCGNVALCYIPNLLASPHVELVALCDSRVEHARQLADQHGIKDVYGDVNEMLREAKIDLLVNLTSMNYHAPINRAALESGVHVWCEKPLATDLKDAHELIQLARQKGLALHAAPNAPTSPAARCMSDILASGEIGKAFTAQGFYGHGGISWGSWFYRKGGGSLFDLGVYNITTLSALLGPVKNVVSFTGIAIPERIVGGETVQVEADDNTALIMDHGHSVFSVVQTGYTFKRQFDDWTIQVIGTGGAMVLNGYDWEPKGVSVCVGDGGKWEKRAEDQGLYAWEGGASYLAEYLAMGEQPPAHGEHSLHVLEIMLAAHQSSQSGQRVAVESSFPWSNNRLV